MMTTDFLTVAGSLGFLDAARAQSYQIFLDGIREINDIVVPVHGLELHCSQEIAKVHEVSPDFAILIEACRNYQYDSSHFLASLINILHPILGCSAVWVEYDASQWDPPNPEPISLPLIYVSPSLRLSPNEFAIKYLEPLLQSLGSWLADQTWNRPQIPDTHKIRQWLLRLPQNTEIQQFGLSFRDNVVQPRLLLEAPQKGAITDLLRSIDSPDILRRKSLEDQMLLAVVYPYSPHELLGLEILADRCSLSSLRQLRHPPRLRGSKLEAVIHALSEQFFDSHIHQWTKQISRIEERSSKLQSGSLFVRLRGLNHAKVVLSAGRLVRTKIYVGEVVNEFSIDC